MGDQDEVTRDLNNEFQSPSFMPGPVIPEGTKVADDGKEYDNRVYLLYYLGTRDDFLWFRVDELNERVESSGWRHVPENQRQPV
jgi:hypothetical protein